MEQVNEDSITKVYDFRLDSLVESPDWCVSCWLLIFLVYDKQKYVFGILWWL